MMRQTIFRTARPALQSATRRQISISAVRMAEGATGGTRSGGAASGDAFTKREEAAETMYVKQKEREKLLALKAKITEQQASLKELEKHIDDLSAQSGEKKN